MTLDVERFAFLLRQKPICTHSPVKQALGPDLHRELRAKYKLVLGLDLLDDRCPNMFNCQMTGEGCIGRPFPNDPQIVEALEGLNVFLSHGTYKGKDIVVARGIVNCSLCPFREECEIPCSSQISYISKTVKPDLSPKGPMLVSFDDFEKGYFGDALNVSEYASIVEDIDNSWRNEELPLDCLTAQQRLIVEEIALKGKTQIELSYETGMDQGLISHQYSSAEAKMKEFGKARKYLKLHGGSKRVHMYYVNNMIEADIALAEGISQQSVNKTISHWRKKHDI